MHVYRKAQLKFSACFTKLDLSNSSQSDHKYSRSKQVPSKWSHDQSFFPNQKKFLNKISQTKLPGRRPTWNTGMNTTKAKHWDTVSLVGATDHNFNAKRRFKKLPENPSWASQQTTFQFWKLRSMVIVGSPINETTRALLTPWTEVCHPVRTPT